MIITLQINSQTYSCNLDKPLDISLPLENGAKGPKCFQAPDLKIEPVRSGSWVGSTKEGGIVNFKNLYINPHGNGTHTECVGHISTEEVNINDVLDKSMIISQVVSLTPRESENGDFIIGTKEIAQVDVISNVSALVIRTTPNEGIKKIKDYSETNPPYLSASALKEIVSLGIEHLLIDLPSVDREYDDGKLAGHRAFWNYPATIDRQKTITELIYVDDDIEDGLYLCDIQIINLAMDASPSRPILYKLNLLDEV